MDAKCILSCYSLAFMFSAFVNCGLILVRIVQKEKLYLESHIIGSLILAFITGSFFVFILLLDEKDDEEKLEG